MVENQESSSTHPAPFGPPVPVALPDEGVVYRHYKGDLYRVITVGRLSEERETWMVVYRSLARGTIWIRPLASDDPEVHGFTDPVPWFDGKTLPRFTPITAAPTPPDKA